MKISPTMNLSDLAERMEDCATEDEAAILRTILISRGYTDVDTSDVDPDEWSLCIDLAVENSGWPW